MKENDVSRSFTHTRERPDGNAPVRSAMTQEQVSCQRFLDELLVGQPITLTGSVLQPWVMCLPLRFQGTLLTAVRGCDFEPKTWTRTGVAYSPGRRITAFIRWCFMQPADPREVSREEGAFFMDTPPENFKPSEFGHLPQHWYSHIMHALEIVGYYHPDPNTKDIGHKLYCEMVHSFHLNIETKDQQWKRLTEDRIAKGTVVS
jgi:hypothetical protein